MSVFLRAGLNSERAPLAFVMCRQRADVIDPGPSEFIRRSSTTVLLHLYLCYCPLPGLPLSLSASLPCLPSSFILDALFFYYSFTAALSPAFW